VDGGAGISAISLFKPGSHIPQTYLRRSRWLQLIRIDHERSAICPSGFPVHLRWIADVLKFARNANRIAQFTTILPLNMDQIVLLEYVATPDDVHTKYFHRRQSPTTAGLPAKLNSVSSTSQASRRSMLGIDYVSAINVHICRSVVPGRAGGCVPGTSAAYENQALLAI